MTENDREYFREVYERHVDDIYRLCFSYLKNSHDSEDAVSSVFCKMMRKRPKFQNGEQEKAWLIVTACNECKTMLRFAKRHPQTDISDIQEASVTEDYEKPEMLEAVMQLDAKYSSVVYLNFYLGYSLTDIAKMTKQNVSTVRSHLFYAKKKLAVIIGGNDNERIQRSNEDSETVGRTEKQNV